MCYIINNAVDCLSKGLVRPTFIQNTSKWQHSGMCDILVFKRSKHSSGCGLYIADSTSSADYTSNNCQARKSVSWKRLRALGFDSVIVNDCDCIRWNRCSFWRCVRFEVKLPHWAWLALITAIINCLLEFWCYCKKNFLLNTGLFVCAKCRWKVWRCSYSMGESSWLVY